MRLSILFFLYSILMVISCKRNNEPNNLYAPRNYIRVSTAEDSLKNSYVIYKSTLDTGRTMFKFYWDNGKLQAISYFRNSVNDGPWSRFFDNGIVWFEGSFVNGRKTGIHKLYFPSGKISIIEEYNKDSAVGVWRYYNPDGSILKTEDHSKR